MTDLEENERVVTTPYNDEGSSRLKLKKESIKSTKSAVSMNPVAGKIDIK